jgi:hypothetical protein
MVGRTDHPMTFQVRMKTQGVKKDATQLVANLAVRQTPEIMVVMKTPAAGDLAMTTPVAAVTTLVEMGLAAMTTPVGTVETAGTAPEETEATVVMGPVVMAMVLEGIPAVKGSNSSSQAFEIELPR